jgi:hypothetical protein
VGIVAGVFPAGAVCETATRNCLSLGEDIGDGLGIMVEELLTLDATRRFRVDSFSDEANQTNSERFC